MSSDTKMARFQSADQPKGTPLKGLKLFSAVFAELTQELGKEFTTAELMQAAQALIEFSKQDYIVKDDRESPARTGYYSMEVWRALERSAWRIAIIESIYCFHCDDGDIKGEASEILKHLLQGERREQWEF